MAEEVILAIDQGTTNTKALLVSRAGRPVFVASVPLTVAHPQPGFAEQDPLALWQSVLSVIQTCDTEARARRYEIAGIAISNQRETALAWRRGTVPAPVSPAISWQCRRSAAVCDRLRPHQDSILSITGLPLDPLASAGKWTWLLENNPALREQAARDDVIFGTIDTWLLNCLTSGAVHATDHTNASRTGLFSLADLRWHNDLLALYGIPPQSLPAVQPSASEYGRCSSVPALQGVPIVALIGDSHAALLGHGALHPGAVKATCGTGSSLMQLTGGLLPGSHALARTVAWSDAAGVRFALEGNIAMAGYAVQWVGEFLGLRHPVADAVALAATVPDSAGLRFVPAMAGLGAPHWNTHARGLVAGLQSSHRAAHLARAAVEAIAFQIADVVYAMERESGATVPALHVDGGATRNDALLQFLANLLTRPVLRSADEELSALGAAWLGGLTLGWWPTTDAFATLPEPPTRFTPDADCDLYPSWQTAIARTTLAGPAHG